MFLPTVTAYTLFILNTVLSSPVPGWHYKKQERHIIYIPHKVQHLHHYHKVPVYIKLKPLFIKEYHDHFHEHKHEHEHEHEHTHEHDHKNKTYRRHHKQVKLNDDHAWSWDDVRWYISVGQKLRCNNILTNISLGTVNVITYRWAAEGSKRRGN